MCHISTSKRASEELKKIGCNAKRFLRVGVGTQSKTLDYTALIDSSLNDSDEIIIDSNGLRVVADASNIPFLEGVTIDFNSGFTFRR